MAERHLPDDSRLRIFWALRELGWREAWRLSKRVPSVEHAHSLLDGSYR